MGEPIVFAKCDPTPGNETLVLIYRPDRSTTKGEKQVHIRASSLDQEFLSEIELFVDVAHPIVDKMGRALVDGPLEFLRVDLGGDGITIDEW